MNYFTGVTLAAPTGNKKDGRSTGHFTYDWTNHLERSLGRFTPFAEAGLANTVADTRFLKHEFTTLGHAAHVEAGTRIRVSRSLSLSASLYDVLPWGPQTLFTRRIRVRTRDGKQQSRTKAVVVGGPELSRDNGFSFALASRLGRHADLWVAYTRSAHMHLNTVSVSFGYDLRSLFKRSRHQ